MYIGVKSDIFQLGMVLWAIAMEQDEPETQTRPLTLVEAPEEIPSYYRALVEICLSDDPRNRLHATALLSMFPEIEDDVQPFYERQAAPDHEEAEYIDPETAVGRDDIDNFRGLSSHSSEANGNPRSNTIHTYVNAPTDMSSEPYYYPTRGRSPSSRSLHDVEELPYTQNHHENSNGVHVLGEQSNDYFQPHIVSVSPRQNELQNFEQDSTLHSESVREVDVSLVTQGTHDHIDVGHVLAEPTSDYFESHPPAMPERSSEQQETPVMEHDLMLHSTSLREQDDAPFTRDPDVHEFKGKVPEEQLEARLRPQVMPVRPSGPQETPTVEEDSTPHSKSDRTAGDMEKPRNTEAAPEPVPGVLVGIGEHSTIEHSVFPQGVLDDDLTNDTQEPPCIL